jgi:glycerol kinase
MPDERLILALDQGTTSSRAIVFDRRGRVVAAAQNEFPQHFPQAGWVEHEAEEIWQSQRDAAVRAVAAVGRERVAAVGITNQRETTLIWDRRTGRPIHRAIVWQDRRTAPICDQLKARGLAPLIQDRTGLLIDPYFSGTKILWLLEHVPGARERADRGELAFGTVDSWLLWKLTGGAVHATDFTNASRTMLLDLRTGTWCDEILRELNVPRALLPEVLPSSGDFGAVADVPQLAALAGLPIRGVAGDQQAALFGQTCFDAGLAKNTYGTGCFMLVNTGDRAVRSSHQLLTTSAWQLRTQPRQFALEGSVFVGGAVVQWLRDGLGLIEKSADVEALAASVPDSGGVVMVPAFTGLGTPHWDPHARGTILGLTRGTTAGHLARAALESIALQVADVLDAMQRDAGTPIAGLRVDGGASANDLLMQFQADVLGVPVVRPKVTETTALGAAYLAGLASGSWSGLDDVRQNWQVDREFKPQMEPVRVAQLRANWMRAVDRSRGWAKD